MSDTEIGGITGFLRLDDTQWDRTIQKVRAQAEALGTISPTITVDADTARAEEQLLAFAAFARAIGAESVTVDINVDQHTNGVGAAEVGAQAVAAAAAIEAAEHGVAEAQDDVAESATAAAAAEGALAATQTTAAASAEAEAEALDDVASSAEATAASQAALAAAYIQAVAAATSNDAAQEAVAEAQDDVAHSAVAATAATEAQTAAQTANAAASNNLAGSQQKVGSLAGWVATGIGAAVAILPAATSAAVAYGGALVGMGGAAVLGIVGASQAMKAGTEVGQQYGSILSNLKGDLDSLANTGAVAMLDDFGRAERSVTGNLPALNSLVRELGSSAGQAGSDIVSGAVTALITMRPLLVSVEGTVEAGASAFRRWAGSTDGFVRFVNDAGHDLPQLNSAFGALVGGVVNFIGAMRPAGPVVLTLVEGVGNLLTGLSQLGPVLPAIAVGAGAAFLAFQLWKGVNAILAGVDAGATSLAATWTRVTAGQWSAAASASANAAATSAQGAAASGAAASTTLLGRALTFSTGPVGLVIAGLGALAAITGVVVAATQQNTKAAADYSSALIQDNNAIGQNTAKLAAQSLQQAGVLGTAKQYGLNLTELTSAVTGNSDAQERVNGVLDKQIAKYEAQASAARMGSNGQSAAAKIAGEHVDALRALQTELEGTTNEIAKEKKQLDDANSASSGAANAAKSQAAAYGMTTTAYRDAAAGAKEHIAQAKAATEAMQMENDAAGLLSNALTLLNGGALSVAQAQTGVASAVNQAKDAFKDNGAAIEGNSAAAVANQQAIQQQVSAAQQMAEAQAKATGSTQAGVDAYKQSKAAIEDALRAQGALTPEVQAYIDKLYDVDNLKVKPTQLEVDTSQGDFGIQHIKDAIASVPDKHDTKAQALVDEAEARLRNLKQNIDSVPASKRTEMQASIAGAQRQLEILQAQIDGMRGKTLTITQRTVLVQEAVNSGAAPGVAKSAYNAHGGTAGVDGIRTQRFAAGGTSGGSVWGSAGSSFSDSIPTWLSIGEEVASAQAMTYPGARSVVKAINSDPAATMQAIAGRDADAAPVTVTVVNKTGMSLSDLIDIKVERATSRRTASVKAGRRQQ
ncbi:hypothetical protein HP467_07210 [Curtobacterium albidum]|uniref:Uncharacterized protein n=1 Tax=Curtobacterium citreum TaxID=2036 RepID=A0A850DUS3_9MICO|nr:hypothetical protein [Curtobacterium albidum]NUU27900.1 hypothetical protein [Curtobacterium albidum]